LLFDPRFAGSNPVEDNGFLRVIKISTGSMTSFRGEVRPMAPYYKILWHIKEP
jgi:hypothetical protein